MRGLLVGSAVSGSRSIAILGSVLDKALVDDIVGFFPRPGILLESSLGTFEIENVL